MAQQHPNHAIAFLGTGLLGKPMAIRLSQSGFTVHAWNRSAEKTQDLITQGLRVTSSPREAIAASDTVILMLSDAAAIRATILSPDTLPTLRGKTVLQMGTIGPDESQAIGHTIEQAGGQYAECPVLGSIPEAREGKLILMFGGAKDLFERLTSVLSALGNQRLYIGSIGTAATMKLAMNQLIATLTAAFSQSLGLIQSAQISVEQFMEILRGSSLYAPTFDKKLQRMLDRNFGNPNFPVKHLLKDVNLFLQNAERSGIASDAAQGVKAVCERAAASGFDDDDYSAIFNVIAQQK